MSHFLPEYYHSTIGIVCKVPRPQLELASFDSEPVVKHSSGKLFGEILGILECQYKELMPAMVVYVLGDGALLAASSEVLAKAEVVPSYNWKGHNCLVTEIKDLQVIEVMPGFDHGDTSPDFRLTICPPQISPKVSPKVSPTML